VTATTPDAVDVLDSPEATRRIIRGSALRTFAYLVSVVASVAVLPFLYRHLGVADAGRYVLVLTVVAIVTGIVESGLAAVSIRRYALAGPDERGTVMSDIVGLRLAMYAASAVVALGFLLVAGYDRVVVVGAAYVAIGALLEAASSAFGVHFTVTLRLWALAAMQLARQLVAVVLTLGLVVAGASLDAFFAVLVLAGFAQFALAYGLTRGRIIHRPSLRPAAWWAIVRPALPFVAAMALGAIYVRLAMVVMSLVASGRETGFFGVPFRLLEITTLVATLMLTAAFPILARSAVHDRERHRYALRRLVEVSLILGGLAALCAAIGAEPIVHALGGDAFAPSAGVLRILALAFALKFLIAAWAFALLSLERHAAVLRANVAATVTVLGATLALVGPLGAEGAAWATVAADVVLTAGYALALALHRRDLAPPLRPVATIVLCALAAGAVGALLPAGAVAATVAAVSVYTVLLLATGAVPAELTAALPGRRAE
jgi:O-antigen/teichoic acid export membrane protein